MPSSHRLDDKPRCRPCRINRRADRMMLLGDDAALVKSSRPSRRVCRGNDADFGSASCDEADKGNRRFEQRLTESAVSEHRDITRQKHRRGRQWAPPHHWSAQMPAAKSNVAAGNIIIGHRLK